MSIIWGSHNRQTILLDHLHLNRAALTLTGTLCLSDEAVEAGVRGGGQSASADTPGQRGDVGHLLRADGGLCVNSGGLNLLQVTPDLIIRGLHSFNFAFASENKVLVGLKKKLDKT